MKINPGHVVRVLAVLVAAMAPLHAQARHCSPASAAGKWAYTYTGTVMTPGGPIPAAAVGYFSQDAAGNLTGNQWRSVAGSSGVEDTSGTVTVNRDCTATASIDILVNGELQRTAVLAGVYDDNMNHARAIFQSVKLPDGSSLPVVLTIDYTRVSSTN